MVVSPLSLDLYYCCIRHLLYCCCTTWWVGGSLRGRHCCATFCCTAVSRWVDRFVAVTMLCVPPVVSPPLCVFFFLFSFSPAMPAPRGHSSAHHHYWNSTTVTLLPLMTSPTTSNCPWDARTRVRVGCRKEKKESTRYAPKSSVNENENEN